MVRRINPRNGKYEGMYEWEIPNSQLRVNVRNRRSDGKRPIDTQFVVEVRVFTGNSLPSNEGIMMAWHNFHGKSMNSKAYSTKYFTNQVYQNSFSSSQVSNTVVNLVFT